MATINYENLPSTTTPLNATNLNTMQQIVEEGQWTPTIGALNETAPTTSYTIQDGKYYKIGKLVYINFSIRGQITALNGTNNYGVIKGLPFSEANADFGKYTIPFGGNYGLCNHTEDAIGVINNNMLRLQYNNGSAATKIVVTQGNYFEIAGSGWYITNS